jgi:cysteinyl-tRNA synthetase
MKSAYELAMERLNASDPDAARPLTAEQKAKLAEIERVYQAKTAEREIFLRQQLDETQAASNWKEADKIKQQLAAEKARLEEEKNDAKNRARSEFSGGEAQKP